MYFECFFFSIRRIGRDKQLRPTEFLGLACMLSLSKSYVTWSSARGMEGNYSRQLLFTNSQLSIFALKVVEESSSRLYLYPWIVKAVLDSFLARVLALIETAAAS